MKIGFMGGTFSPPHVGHLHSAKVFIEEMNLEKLLIIPAKVSPFKVNTEATASDFDRMEMAKICFLPLDGEKCKVEVSNIEINKNETSFTIDTINFLKTQYPEDELIMFVGSDMFLSLEKWRQSSDIFAKCRIYTRCRHENEEKIMAEQKKRYEDLYNAKVTFSKDDEIEVSSTDVRNAVFLKNEQSCRNLLTEDILRYIINRRLYLQENNEQ